MNTKTLGGIVLISILLMAGAVVYHNDSYLNNAPQFPAYPLNIHVKNTTSIENVTISSIYGSYSYNVSSAYFNVSLKGFTNYSISFSNYFINTPQVNQTLHVYMSNIEYLTVTRSAVKVYYPTSITANSPTIQNTTFTLSNTPSGSGYYQQLLTIPLTSSINPRIGNFYFTTGNTELYAWVQSYNTSDMSVWIKTPNGTSAITMYSGFPSGFYSSNGYVGLAPQLSPTYAEYDNGKMVFPFYEDFKSGILKNFTTNYAQYLTFNDGLKILDGNSSLTVLSNISQGNSGTVLWNGEFNTGTSSTTVSQGTTTGALYLGFQFTGNIANGFIWLNATAHPTQFMYDNSFSSGSNANYLTNTFQNYMVQTNESANGTQYMGFYLNNSEQQNAYTYNRNYSGNFGFSTQQQSVAYEIWHYVAETSFLFSKMPTYNIELNTYNVNIKSFDKQSNSIHNYFFYNNSVYSANNNTFIFKNKTSFSEISLIPLNFSSYFTEYKNITISQSQFINNNNSYYYNLSIYYYNSNLNTVNPYDFTNYIYPISILVFLLFGGIVVFGSIKYRRRN